jgi:hypothetical protein
MTTLDLLFDGKAFAVPKKSLVEFLDHCGLLEASSYAVQSSVAVDVFERFVASLKTQSKIAVTKGNAVSLWSLATEFFLSDVAAECATFSVSVDQFARLSDRVSKLERQVASFSNPPGDALRLAFEALKTSLESELSQLRTQRSQPPASPKPPKPQTKLEFPMAAAESLDGIISYLTKNHGGNVHEKGIVTITSKSVWSGDLKNVADLTAHSRFTSQNEPGQWICWDFGEMRVRPTNYTIPTIRLKSWVVEVSVDGHAWTEVDRQVGIQVFRYDWVTGSFAVSSPEVGRFIRLTQTEKSHCGYHFLSLSAAEFFGILYCTPFAFR